MDPDRAKPKRCLGCKTPIWVWQRERREWECFNCPLYDAIHRRDDTERERLMAIIRSRSESEKNWPRA